MQIQTFLVGVVGVLAVAGMAYAGGPAATAVAANDWLPLFADQNWYKGQAGAEEVIAGKLESVTPPEISTLQRNSYYKIGARMIYTGAKKLAALDALVGKQVEVRGKLVEMNLEGQHLNEIWPAAVRAGQARPEVAPVAPKPVPRSEQ